MPHPDDQRDEARKSLDEGLKAFDKKRARPGLIGVDVGSMGEGYRLLAVMFSGVFGGLGLGWGFDRIAPGLIGVHTSPIGVIVGLLVGLALSVVSAVGAATQMSAGSAKKPTGPIPSVPDDDDDD
jgi:ATP synthase protein I